RHVIVPAVAPRIATGIRIAIPISLILVVTSELVGSSEGIGFVIVDAQATFKLVDMWSGIVLLGLLGFLLTWLFGLLERRLLRWTPAQREPSLSSWRRSDADRRSHQQGLRRRTAGGRRLHLRGGRRRVLHRRRT